MYSVTGIPPVPYIEFPLYFRPDLLQYATTPHLYPQITYMYKS